SQRKPLDEQKRALNLLRPGHQRTRPNRAALLLLRTSSASPRSRPLLAISGVCQGVFPALTNPRNCGTQYGIGVMQKRHSVRYSKQPSPKNDRAKTNPNATKPPETRLPQGQTPTQPVRIWVFRQTVLDGG